MATIKATTTAPYVSSSDETEAQALSNYLDGKGVTTDAQFSTHVNGLSDAQFILLLRSWVKKRFVIGLSGPP